MLDSCSDKNETPKKLVSFKSLGSEKVLGLKKQGKQNSAIIENDFGDESQAFFIEFLDQDCHIRCKHNSLYLTVQNVENGAKVYCAGKSNQPNQKFRIEETSPGSEEYLIYTFCGKVLDSINQFSKEDSSSLKRVVQNEANGNPTQKWIFNSKKQVNI